VVARGRIEDVMAVSAEIRATSMSEPTTELPTQGVVCLAPDLLLATRLRDVVQAQGGRPIVVETPEAFVAAMDRYFPVLAFVDLSTPGDWQGAIARCKLRPHTKQIPIYAFGSHVDGETFKAARQLHPPVSYPEGWDAQLSDLARTGLIEFNQGKFFEQHEHLEEAWLAETRPIREMYQGILQVGVAFLQIQRGNWAGALKMFRRGLPRLRGLPDVCQGVQIGKLRAAAEAIHAELTGSGPERLAEFDQHRFPQIEFQ
jgi:hypothetical protein